MAINKITLNNTELINLENDTIEESLVIPGKRFHKPNGDTVYGNMPYVSPSSSISVDNNNSHVSLIQTLSSDYGYIEKTDSVNLKTLTIPQDKVLDTLTINAKSTGTASGKIETINNGGTITTLNNSGSINTLDNIGNIKIDHNDSQHGSVSIDAYDSEGAKTDPQVIIDAGKWNSHAITPQSTAQGPFYGETYVEAATTDPAIWKNITASTTGSLPFIETTGLASKDLKISSLIVPSNIILGSITNNGGITTLTNNNTISTLNNSGSLTIKNTSNTTGNIYINAYSNSSLTGTQDIVKEGQWIQNTITPSSAEQGPFYGRTTVNAITVGTLSNVTTTTTASTNIPLVTTAGYLDSSYMTELTIPQSKTLSKLVFKPGTTKSYTAVSTITLDKYSQINEINLSSSYAYISNLYGSGYVTISSGKTLNSITNSGTITNISNTGTITSLNNTGTISNLYGKNGTVIIGSNATLNKIINNGGNIITLQKNNSVTPEYNKYLIMNGISNGIYIKSSGTFESSNSIYIFYKLTSSISSGSVQIRTMLSSSTDITDLSLSSNSWKTTGINISKEDTNVEIISLVKNTAAVSAELNVGYSTSASSSPSSSLRTITIKSSETYIITIMKFNDEEDFAIAISKVDGENFNSSIS